VPFYAELFVKMENDNFGVNMRRPIVGKLWHCCGTVCEAVELPFGVVSGIRPRKGLSDRI